MPPEENPIHREAVGLAIRELRADRQLSMGTVSERSGLSVSWLSRLETGRHESTWDGLKKVAKGLAVSMPELAKEIELRERELERSR